MEERESIHDRIKRLQRQNEGLEQELEKYIRCNRHILRVLKEKENAKRGLYPKKEHTGYCFVNFVPIDTRCRIDGSFKTIRLYQTTFQTPYTIDFDYYDVFKMIDDDLTRTDDRGYSLLKELGCENYVRDKIYEEIVANEIKEKREQIYLELVEDFTIKHDGREPYWDEQCELHDKSKTKEVRFFFNTIVKANGERGYWEVVLKSTCPLPPIPKEMRFKKGNKDETKKKDVL